MNGAEAALKALAPLDVLVRAQRLLAAAPRHVLNELLLASRQRPFVARATLDVSQRVGHKPVPRGCGSASSPAARKAGVQ